MGEMSKSFPTEGATGTTTPGARSIEVRDRPKPGDGGKITGEIEAAASNVANQAKEMVSNQVTQRASRSADDLGNVANALRRTRGELSGNMAAPYIDKAADQLEKLSDFMRHADAREVVQRVETFARREPLLFLGGAFALGMIGARFLKSSARHPRQWGDDDEDAERRFEGEGGRSFTSRYGEGESRSWDDPARARQSSGYGQQQQGWHRGQEHTGPGRTGSQGTNYGYRGDYGEPGKAGGAQSTPTTPEPAGRTTPYGGQSTSQGEWPPAGEGRQS